MDLHLHIVKRVHNSQSSFVIKILGTIKYNISFCCVFQGNGEVLMIFSYFPEIENELPTWYHEENLKSEVAI